MKDLTISSQSYEAIMDRMAYTVGFFLGDGCITTYPFKSNRNGKIYQKNDTVFGKPDVETLERVKFAISDVFGFEPKITKRILDSGSEYYELKAYRRDIFEFFSFNTSMRTAIPHYYFGAPSDVQKQLVMGLFDSDGHIAEFKDGEVLRWQMGFSNTNRKLVEDCAYLLKKNGVQVGKVCEAVGKKGTTYVIHPNILSYVSAGMKFYSQRRQVRVERYLAHVLGSETKDTAAST